MAPRMPVSATIQSSRPSRSIGTVRQSELPEMELNVELGGPRARGLWRKGRVSTADLRRYCGEFGPWTGMAADGSPLLVRDIGSEDVYALDLHCREGSDCRRRYS